MSDPKPARTHTREISAEAWPPVPPPAALAEIARLSAGAGQPDEIRRVVLGVVEAVWRTRRGFVTVNFSDAGAPEQGECAWGDRGWEIASTKSFGSWLLASVAGAPMSPVMSTDVPDWHATALALAAHPERPRGLCRHTLSEGAWQMQCGACGQPWRGPRAYCRECGKRPPRKVEITPAVRVIALDDSPAGLANEGPLRAALWAASRTGRTDGGPAFQLSVRAPVASNYGAPPDEWRVYLYLEAEDPHHRWHCSPHFAHALALAFLAVHR